MVTSCRGYLTCLLVPSLWVIVSRIAELSLASITYGKINGFEEYCLVWLLVCHLHTRG
jgi:hypothetical protein